MSEIEETKIIEDSAEIEKPKKERKPFVMTEARKEAFERCRQKRQEKIKAREDAKLVTATEIIAEKRVRERVSDPFTPRGERGGLCPPESEAKKAEVVQPTVKTVKKTKKVVVYASSSDSESDASIEIEVIKKPRKSKSVVSPHNTAINTLISWV